MQLWSIIPQKIGKNYQESYIQKLSFKNEDKDINQINENNKFAYRKQPHKTLKGAAQF